MTDKETKIKVELPLPLDVAATITKLIGAAYPAAMMATDGYGRCMTFIIPYAARAKRVSKRAAEPQHVDESTDADLLEMNANGVSISTPHELAAACLQIVKAAFEEYPDAKNYLEQKLWDQSTGKHYAMTFQRVEGSSPAELRTEAEAKISAALALHSHDDGGPDPETGWGQCNGCLKIDPGAWAPWPCETARLLDPTLEEPKR
jgi:hypothetical protein